VAKNKKILKNIYEMSLKAMKTKTN